MQDDTDTGAEQSNPLFGLIIGLLFMGVGFWVAQEIYPLVANGVRSPGVVVELQKERQRNPNRTLYRPIVEFEYENRTVRFGDKIASKKITYKPGDKVTVLHHRDVPSDAMIDEGLGNWQFPGILIFIGGITVLFCGLKIKSRLKQS
jgi:hypothetical protein